MEEIERPLLVGSLRRRGTTAPDARQGFARAAADGQAFLPIEPFDPLVVDDDALPAQQDVQSPIAKARPLRGQLAQPGAQCLVITSPTGHW